ncbi:hypothetical protein GWK47_012071 [Chionoecetes opilio]|uniref:Uncharacterized protein n=1 Tax=Chionoecetes opilio TaxID=41210 RepID=A0A8J4Y2F3_CHIOP|nr:hypothetical protein GWK47_012071 [Chionoecetes opilio]
MLIGYPGRFEGDVWYMCGPEDPPQPATMTIARVNDGYYRSSDLSPHVRAQGLLGGKGDLTTAEITAFVDRELPNHTDRMDIHAVGLSALERVARIRRTHLRAGTEDDILTIHWLKQKTGGYLSSAIKYHYSGTELHVMCGCSEPMLEFRPIDELMAVYLLYIYLGH